MGRPADECVGELGHYRGELLAQPRSAIHPIRDRIQQVLPIVGEKKPPNDRHSHHGCETNQGEV